MRYEIYEFFLKVMRRSIGHVHSIIEFMYLPVHILLADYIKGIHSTIDMSVFVTVEMACCTSVFSF